MSRVGVVAHASKAEAHELARKVVAWLARQPDTRRASCRDEAEIVGVECVVDPDEFTKLDLLLVLGGDGTMLHGIERAGFSGVPILGVNLGRLGFLTETSPDDVFDALERALAGDCTLDERSTVAATVRRPDGSVEHLGEAINEFSVERADRRQGHPDDADDRRTAVHDVRRGRADRRDADGIDGVRVLDARAGRVAGAALPRRRRRRRARAVRPSARGGRRSGRRGGRPVRGPGDRRRRRTSGDGDRRGRRAADVRRPSTVQLVRLAPDSFFTRLARRFGVPEG